MARIKKLLVRILLVIRKVRREKYTKKWRQHLCNTTFSLISNNCNGGVVLKELGMRFNSQFINFNINARDYIKYLKNFEYYNQLSLSFIDSTTNYPIGKLGDLTIEFIHYESEEEVVEKWNKRKKRINKDNMFIIFTEQEDCTEDMVLEFDSLPFKNKVVFTYRKYENVKSAFFVKEYEYNAQGVYMFLGFKNLWSKQRNYDIFDWIAWFNGESDLKKLKKL